MDFKWTLSRPGIALEFETGSIREAIGLLEAEGTQISEVFGFVLGAPGAPTADGAAAPAAEGVATEPKKRGRPAKPPVEAVAPDPLPVPAPVEVVAAPPVLPSPPIAPAAPVAAPAALVATIPADGGIPPFLARTAAPPLPAAAPAAAPPPVGVLGPKVVTALNALREGKPDGGQALADWLAAAGLTIKGKTYDEATRALLMISDEKITQAGILEPLAIQ